MERNRRYSRHENKRKGMTKEEIEMLRDERSGKDIKTEIIIEEVRG